MSKEKVNPFRKGGSTSALLGPLPSIEQDVNRMRKTHRRTKSESKNKARSEGTGREVGDAVQHTVSPVHGTVGVTGRLRAVKGRSVLQSEDSGAVYKLANAEVLPSLSPLVTYRLDVHHSRKDGDLVTIRQVRWWKWETLRMDQVLSLVAKAMSEATGTSSVLAFKERDCETSWDNKKMVPVRVITPVAVRTARYGDTMVMDTLQDEILDGCFLSPMAMVARHVIRKIYSEDSAIWQYYGRAGFCHMRAKELEGLAPHLLKDPYLLVLPSQFFDEIGKELNEQVWGSRPQASSHSVSSVPEDLESDEHSDPKNDCKRSPFPGWEGQNDEISCSDLEGVAIRSSIVDPTFLFGRDKSDLPTHTKVPCSDLVVYAACFILLDIKNRYEQKGETLADLSKMNSVPFWGVFHPKDEGPLPSSLRSRIGARQLVDITVVHDTAIKALTKAGAVVSFVSGRHVAFRDFYQVESSFFTAMRDLAAKSNCRFSLIDYSVASTTTIVNVLYHVVAEYGLATPGPNIGRGSPLRDKSRVLVMIPKSMFDNLNYSNEEISRRILQTIKAGIPGAIVGTVESIVNKIIDPNSVKAMVLLQLSRWSVNDLTNLLVASDYRELQHLYFFDDWFGSDLQYEQAIHVEPDTVEEFSSAKVKLPGRKVFDCLIRNCPHLYKWMPFSQVSLGFLDTHAELSHAANSQMIMDPSPFRARRRMSLPFNVPLDRALPKMKVIPLDRSLNSGGANSSISEDQEDASSSSDEDEEDGILPPVDEFSPETSLLSSRLPQLQRLLRATCITGDRILIDKFVFSLPHWPTLATKGDSLDRVDQRGRRILEDAMKSKNGVMIRGSDEERIIQNCLNFCTESDYSLLVFCQSQSTRYSAYRKFIKTEQLKAREHLKKGMYAWSKVHKAYVVVKSTPISDDDLYTVLRLRRNEKMLQDLAKGIGSFGSGPNETSTTFKPRRSRFTSMIKGTGLDEESSFTNLEDPDLMLPRPNKMVRVSSMQQVESGVYCEVKEEKIAGNLLEPALMVPFEDVAMLPAAVDIVVLAVESTRSKLPVCDSRIVDQISSKAGKILVFAGSDHNLKKAFVHREVSVNSALENVFLKRVCEDAADTFRDSEIVVLNGGDGAGPFVDNDDDVAETSAAIQKLLSRSAGLGFQSVRIKVKNLTLTPQLSAEVREAEGERSLSFADELRSSNGFGGAMAFDTRPWQKQQRAFPNLKDLKSMGLFDDSPVSKPKTKEGGSIGSVLDLLGGNYAFRKNAADSPTPSEEAASARRSTCPFTP